MVRFLHISDSHIGADPAFQTCGHCPFRESRQLVDVINALPYAFDFVLHTGDVSDDGSDASYRSAAALLSQLDAPIYYLAGNHDSAVKIQRDVVGESAPSDRYDQTFEAGGLQFLLLDSRGAAGSGGELASTQIEKIKSLCTVDGPPLVIALHHPPIPLDVPWIDDDPTMRLSDRDAFTEAIRPAARRLRGVFFGHVHRAFQVVQDGILFSSAPSVFAQLKTWPGLAAAMLAKEEAPGYCVVTIDERRTLVQQYSFERAAGEWHSASTLT